MITSGGIQCVSNSYSLARTSSNLKKIIINNKKKESEIQVLFRCKTNFLFFYFICYLATINYEKLQKSNKVLMIKATNSKSLYYQAWEWPGGGGCSGVGV